MLSPRRRLGLPSVDGFRDFLTQNYLGDEGLLLVGKNGLLWNFGSVNVGGLRRLLGRSIGEGRGLLDGLGNDGIGLGSSGRATLATQHLLNLAGVVAGVLLAKGSDLLGLLLGNAANLGGLSLNDVRGVLDVLIDQLLIGDVDQGQDEGENSAKDGKTPVRNQLRKVVADEGKDSGLQCQLRYNGSCTSGRTNSNRNGHVLHKQDTLRLNDDEVDKLMSVTNEAVDGLTRHRIVSTRAKLRGKAVVKQELAHHLSRDGDAKSHP